MMPRINPIGGIVRPPPLTGIPPYQSVPVYKDNVPDELARAHPMVSLFVETAQASNTFTPLAHWDWERVVQGMDGKDSTCTIRAMIQADDLTTAGSLGVKHLTHLKDEIMSGRRVRVAQTFGEYGAHLLFQGYPQSVQIVRGPQGQSLVVTCVSEADEALQCGLFQQIFERHVRFAPDLPWDESQPDLKPVSGLLPIFNEGGRRNRGFDAHPVKLLGNTYKLHPWAGDGEVDAWHWSVAEALRHLVIVHLGLAQTDAKISVVEFLKDTEELVGINPIPEEVGTELYAARMSADLRSLSLASVSVREALTRLTRAAGLHWELRPRMIATDVMNAAAEWMLRIIAVPAGPGDLSTESENFQQIAPALHSLRQAPPFTDYSSAEPATIAEDNRHQQISCSIDSRVDNAPIVLGGFREYEVTLLLRPGWYPEVSLDNIQGTSEADLGMQIDAAMAVWQSRFEEDAEDANKPVTPYDSRHADHGQYVDGGALLNRYCDVGRLWIFPDTIAYAATAEEPSPYARHNGAVNGDGGMEWSDEHYSPYEPAPENPRPDRNPDAGLIYVHPTLGGGLADAKTWCPIPRPFQDTIGRREATGDREISVMISTTTSDVTQLDQWQRWTGQCHFDRHRGAITFSEDRLLSPEHGPKFGAADDGELPIVELIMRGKLFVAVTCTIRGDQRIKSTPWDPLESTCRHASLSIL